MIIKEKEFILPATYLRQTNLLYIYLIAKIAYIIVTSV